MKQKSYVVRILLFIYCHDSLPTIPTAAHVAVSGVHNLFSSKWETNNSKTTIASDWLHIMNCQWHYFTTRRICSMPTGEQFSINTMPERTRWFFIWRNTRKYHGANVLPAHLLHLHECLWRVCKIERNINMLFEYHFSLHHHFYISWFRIASIEWRGAYAENDINTILIFCWAYL